jgi:hypothetical protein
MWKKRERNTGERRNGDKDMKGVRKGSKRARNSPLKGQWALNISSSTIIEIDLAY